MRDPLHDRGCRRSRYACRMSASLDDASVAPLVRKTAAWAWRFLVILAAVALLWVLNKFEVIVVPVLLALMLSKRRWIGWTPGARRTLSR